MPFPKGKHNPKAKHLIKLQCEACGETFEVFPCQAKRRFCSNKCYDRTKYNPFKGKRHTETAKLKMSLQRRGKPGKPINDEMRRRLNLGRQQRLASDPELRAKYGEHLAKFQYLSRTPETRAKLSESLRKVNQNPVVRAKHKHVATVKEREQISQRQLEAWANPIVRAKRVATTQSSHNTAEYRQRVSYLAQQQWDDPVKRERLLNGLSKGLRKRPTKPERTLIDLLDEHFPKQWLYTGDGKVRIGRYFPDFINCNGKKLIIEFFGEYWHTEDEELLKTKAYAELGYKTLILWQRDLAKKKREALLGKIKAFCSP